MNIGTIDAALETYVNERLAKGKEKAIERFLAYVYLKHGSDEILDFLLKVGGLARCYIYCLKIVENPLKGQEMGWFSAAELASLATPPADAELIARLTKEGERG